MSTPLSNSRQSSSAPLSIFQQHALNLAAQQSLDTDNVHLLARLRQQGAREFESANWPGRKTESWKYTSLQTMNAFESATWSAESAVSRASLSSLLIPVQATQLVFVDGRFDAALSDELPEGVCLFSQADAASGAIIESLIGKIADSVDPCRRNLFASLNSAWTNDGLLIHVARNVVVETPLYLVYVSTSQSNCVANLRTLMVLEQNANAQLIEHFLSADQRVNNSFVNNLTEIQVGQNAHLHHTRLNLEHESIAHVGAVHVNLMRDAVFNGFTLSEGSKLKRIDYQLNQCGQGAALSFDGVYLAHHDQHIDYHTCIEHRVPHCTSQQVFRGIIGDKAKAVFNGRIHIHEDAQKTLAEMSNRNLLTSNSAEINTKPELEIYADDVKCAHGATISQLDETALYYLLSRGISPAQARTMLSYGFVNERLSALPSGDLRVWLEHWLQTKFSEDRSLVSENKAVSDVETDH